MSVLNWILAASALGGVLSLLIAAAVAFNARAQWINSLVGYAIGAMLGAAFLEIIPEAFDSAGNAEAMAATILVGILLFFVLEKLVLWRHCHGEECEAHAVPTLDHGHAHAHQNDHGRSGLMITVGDTFHNFVDGILIAAAFMTDIKLGTVTALAIIAHEIPQEVGDFLILLHSGYSRRQAFMLNLLASMATLVGGVLAYYALDMVRDLVPYVLGVAAASMIYVAVADLIPGLHKRTELHATVQQVTLIGLGVGSILLVKWLLGDLA